MSGKNTNFSENPNSFANFPVVFWTTFRSAVLLLFCAFTLDCCATHFELSASKITEDEIFIPLVQAGKILLIEAEVDGQRGNFILDTGAPYLVLNTTYFRNSIRIDTLEASGINGLPCDVCRTRITRMDLASLRYDSLEADVISLGEIENKRGVKILGLFGLDLLRSFRIEIDLRKQLMIIHTGTDKKQRPNLVWPFEVKNSTLIFQAEMEKKSMTWVLDSGAEVIVLGSHVKKKILKGFQIQRQVNLIGSTGEPVEVFYGNLPALTIANQAFEGFPAILGSLDSMGKAYGFEIDAMIGYDLFARGRVIIDFVEQEIHMYLYP